VIYPNYIRGWFRERNSFYDFFCGGRKSIEKTRKEKRRKKRGWKIEEI
jgi:hypothetical protein